MVRDNTPIYIAHLVTRSLLVALTDQVIIENTINNLRCFLFASITAYHNRLDCLLHTAALLHPLRAAPTCEALIGRTRIKNLATQINDCSGICNCLQLPDFRFVFGDGLVQAPQLPSHALDLVLLALYFCFRCCCP